MAAASTSREPHEVPLPSTPKSGSKKSKGKGKERASQKRRVRPSSLEELDSEQWNWISLTDSSPTDFPPIFTQDTSYFFSLVGASVKIYASATGQVVSTLTPPRISSRESDSVTCAILNPQNTFQLITGSLDGCLRIWDFMDGNLLKIIDLAQPILRICAHIQHKDLVFAAVSRPKKPDQTDDHAFVLRVSLNTLESSSASSLQKSFDILPIGKTRSPTGLALSPSGAYLVATAGYKTYVAATSSLESGFTKYVSTEQLTCLAFHPFEDYFATGDAKGVIRLWYCLNDQVTVKTVGIEKKTQTSSLHWHAHAVSSIAFTLNGAYLLSGGEESVLVVWQLSTGRKEFVPRLGSPINTISLSSGHNEEEYLLGLADATFIFINAEALKVSRSFCRIKLNPGTDRRSLKNAPLAYHYSTSTLVLPSSHPSSVQVYSPSSSALLSELEVAPSNRISRRDERPLEHARVEKITISSSGDWMATVDVRDGDGSFRGEIYLKFWKWDSDSSYWELNTRVDRPHGLRNVTHVSFSTQSMHLVTTGADGFIKTWRLQRSSSDRNDFWVARSTTSFRSERPTHATWSLDASLLAVSLGPYVALYDPLSNVLCKTLTGSQRKRVYGTHFIGKSCRYLAVRGRFEVTVWDLVSQTISWHYSSRHEIQDLISHPQAESFALFERVLDKATRISIFQTSSPKPLQTRSVPLSLLNVAWYPSSQLQESAFSFVAITTSWSVIVLGDEIQILDEDTTATAISTAALPQRRTLFQDIFGKAALEAPSTSSSAPVYQPPLTGDSLDKIFSVPYYSMPSLNGLYHSLMEPFLTARPEDTRTPSESPMVIDPEEETLSVSTSHNKQREVDAAELSALVDLFKKQTIKTSHPVVVPHANGIVKEGKVNGVVTHTPIKTKPTVASQSSSPLPSSINGKKRKKP